MRRTCLLVASAAALSLAVGAGSAQAALLTFDDAITGSTSYQFDGDGDGVPDVVFTTVDPFGFNTIGPGLNQQYIDEPGLEGTAELPIDLRVDFLSGARDSLSFGYAVDAFSETVFGALTFSVYDVSDGLLTSVTSDASMGGSSFPEAFVTATFAGRASYATFAFLDGTDRFIIDNFAGVFGSTETGAIPEPATWALMLLGFGTLGAVVRRRRPAVA